MPFKGREGIVEVVVRSCRVVKDVRLVQRLSIDIHLLIHELEAVARQADHAFHKMLMLGVGILKDDDVAPLQWPVWKHFLIPRAAAAENELVNKQMVANQQRPFHGSRGNFKRLNDKACPEQRQ